MIKPKRLNVGDKVAIVTPSWGGPATFPEVYELGKKQIEKELGLKVVEMPSARRDAQWLYENPQARATDLTAAFKDPSINGIFSTVGGDEAIRVLRFLDLDVVKKNPKIFLGYSDMTTIHLALFQAGLSSFYGPTVMVEFAEKGGILPYTLDGLKRVLFSNEPIGKLSGSQNFTLQNPGWMTGVKSEVRELKARMPWKVIQGTGIASGPLLGGCFEALEFAKGTSFWPPLSQWKGALLFLETYEAPSVTYCEHWLRNYASQGILHQVNGILFGRPGGPKLSEEDYEKYDLAFLKITRECGLTQLPIMTRMDFGHTDPKLTLPYGLIAKLDCATATLTFDESAVE